MDERTAQALEESIKHWERLLELAKVGTLAYFAAEGLGTDSCALCQEFYDEDSETCHGCPVAMTTGEWVCRRTPYREVMKAYLIELNQAVGYSKSKPSNLVAAVNAELEFLKGLREIPQPKK